MTQKILIIDDNENHRELIKANIQSEIPDVEVLEADSANAALKSLSKDTFNLIMLDYNMPGLNGIQFLEETKKLRAKTPVIMVTGSGNEQLAAKAFKLGVTDYIIKSIDLPHQVTNVIKDVFSSPDNTRETPSANLNSVESGIRLVQEYQEALNKRKFTEGTVKEMLIIEFEKAHAFNQFSRWVMERKNIEIKKIEILGNKYVLLITVYPVGYKKIS